MIRASRWWRFDLNSNGQRLFLIRPTSRSFHIGHRRQTQSHHKDLRILFCGSDAFSIESLRAIHTEFLSSTSNILSIDVVTKKDKRSGRGLKQLKAPPIKDVALELGLPLHQIDTFRGWTPPTYSFNASEINLVIAVSFGLLIPPRIINSCRYGGLNVHPSMLPDLKGAAPIQWAIIQGRERTGVSLQTLHPSKFDEGLVIDQTRAPGIAIPNPNSIKYSDLRNFLAPIGADMLVRAIRNRLYISPVGIAGADNKRHSTSLSFAPRITPIHKVIDFRSMSANDILNRNRAIPKLYAFTATSSNDGHSRMLFESDLRAVGVNDIPPELRNVCTEIPIGVPYTFLEKDEDVLNCNTPLYINTLVKEPLEYKSITIPSITIAGSSTGPAAMAAARAHLFKEPISFSGYKMYQFSTALATSATPWDS